MAAIPRTRSALPLEATDLGGLRERIRAATLRSEPRAVAEMREALLPLADTLEAARGRAIRWVEAAREHVRSRPLAESLLDQFPLDSRQGKALMSLAEALLRTPDRVCADRLIAERLAALREGGRAKSSDLTVRMALALLNTASRLLPDASAGLSANARRPLLTPVVTPVIRAALRRAMRMMGHAFIVGESIESALARSHRDSELSLCSFDVLGEGARSEADAQRYFDAYERAIDALRSQPTDSVHRRSGISVKLSALEPRYSLTQHARVMEGLVPRMLTLARRACAAGIGLTIDAEEADRLDPSLDIIAALARDAGTRGWSGLGLAVQAYGRRAPLVLDWVAELARQTGRRMSARLVKGAYWDAEIKRAQERGLDSFPVYTSKAATDASYIVCTRRLFEARDVIYPQFATHNALTVAAVTAIAPQGAVYEFQRLHGMGQALYEAVRAEVPDLPPVRVYAPVGTYEELLPYLVRRLLENGANTSFVHHFLNKDVPVEQVVGQIMGKVIPNSAGAAAAARADSPARIREPSELYRSRRNSRGADFGNPAELAALQGELRAGADASYLGGPILSQGEAIEPNVPVRSPASTAQFVGLTRDATEAEIAGAMTSCARAQRAWDATPAEGRAACLEKAADLLEQRRGLFLNLLVREAGKTLPDSIAEIREAADFCRYYARRGRELFAAAQELDGPVGERNLLSFHGRGVFACISPWNFPLAIFTGQITAALMAGNAVVAKPAPATTLVAHAMTRLLHDAGIPRDAVQLAPADGPLFGATALTHPALAGVAFTGSTATAATINRTLAGRDGPIVPLIAETGGVNAMIVDATALPEQVVDDVIGSAFTSAGQRCSALRVMYVQEEIADRVLEMLIGAMRCLTLGDPADPATDVGPVISGDAQQRLLRHARRMGIEAKLLYSCPVEHCEESGHFFGPRLFELSSPDQLQTEEFGPILHVYRYRADELAQVLAAIRSTGFGLTLGVHSRLESMAEHAFRTLPVGNTYVNRNMIGAVVGVQPFGGQGLSGTGPKAGGPNYLQRFATERTLTINTAAIGGAVEIL
ncbi:MAG TPA: bifunctional proline dehydrogenase/L-glutamate gamma-semialdehyde dehydrogenase PutA [Steroidobacteraceae bacterium]|jgi:RHH-type proline utilization regulon transcriptional repressor/proline dehydrogenase/delta 1-pyrroline-5-carboxylate dehydrogenase